MPSSAGPWGDLLAPPQSDNPPLDTEDWAECLRLRESEQEGARREVRGEAEEPPGCEDPHRLVAAEWPSAQSASIEAAEERCEFSE